MVIPPPAPAPPDGGARMFVLNDTCSNLDQVTTFVTHTTCLIAFGEPRSGGSLEANPGRWCG